MGIAMLKEVFGQLPDGRAAEAYTLTNANGMKVKITNYGGAVMQIMVPDREGRVAMLFAGMTVWRITVWATAIRVR